MRCRLIGIGAAGNKAAITAVENDVISVENTMLINSTLKDIPADYLSKPGAVVRKYEGAYGGCGKERKISLDLAMNNLEADTLGLEKFLDIGTDNQCELCIIVASLWPFVYIQKLEITCAFLLTHVISNKTQCRFIYNYDSRAASASTMSTS